MFFLNPICLWALLGLAVPLAIHLWSKKEGKTIKIGSVQLLKKADAKQSSSVKLNEFWLLLLRLFLISVLILIISNVRFRKKIDNVAITYIVESSLLQNKEFKSILDTISTKSSIRLLQDGFPEYDLETDQEFASTIPNYWQLAREMQSLPSDSIIVFTNAYQSGFKSLRPEISGHIEWIPISIDKTSKHLLEANQLNEDLELLMMNVSDHQVSFDKELVKSNNIKINLNTSKDSVFYLENWTAINDMKTSQVLLFYDTGFLSESIYIEAGFKVISDYLNHKIDLVTTNKINNIEDKEFDIVIWLSEKPIIDANGNVLLFEANQFSNHLIEENSIQGIYHLTRFLDTENIETDHLPEQLIQLLDLNPGIDEKINRHDRLVLSKEAMVPTLSNDKRGKHNKESLDITKWLWALFVLLLTSERIVSYYRQQ